MKNSKLVKNQSKTFTTSNVTFEGCKYRKVEAVVRFDDHCGNGHNTFSITGSAWDAGSRRRDPDTCGCIHDLIAHAFPELAHLIEFHLMSSDSPMHYVANTLYNMSDKDVYGRRKGEPYNPKRFVLLGNSEYPLNFRREITDYLESAQKNGFILSVEPVSHKDNSKGGYQFAAKYTFSGLASVWHQCPFDNMLEAEGFIRTANKHGFAIVSKNTSIGKGKTPDIEAARRSAIWPDATAEQLSSKEALEARLPMLVNRLADAVESLGMEF